MCVCVHVSVSVRQHKDLVEQVTKATTTTANVKAKQKMRMQADKVNREHKKEIRKERA